MFIVQLKGKLKKFVSGAPDLARLHSSRSMFFWHATCSDVKILLLRPKTWHSLIPNEDENNESSHSGRRIGDSHQ